jgi:hypothetical protein
VRTAVELVRPYAIDVSSGVESSPGIKDPGKLRAFFAAIGAEQARVGQSRDLKLTNPEPHEPMNPERHEP